MKKIEELTNESGQITTGQNKAAKTDSVEPGYSADGRLSKLETKVSLLIWLVAVLIPVVAGAAGVVYWKLWDIGKDLGALTSRVDGHDKEAVMKLFSAIQTDGGNNAAAKELKQAVEKIVSDTMEMKQRGEAVQPGLYYELGLFSANNGKLETAVDYFQQAIKGNPLDYRALSSMGACYLYLARKQADQKTYYATKAIDVLKKAVDIKQDHTKAHSNLGIAYYLTGQRAAAIDEWNTAIRIDTQYEGPYYNLACMYAEEKATERALQFLEKAIINCNYSNLSELDSDDSLESLRDNPKFKSLREIVATRNRNAVMQ